MYFDCMMIDRLIVMMCFTESLCINKCVYHMKQVVRKCNMYACTHLKTYNICVPFAA